MGWEPDEPEDEPRDEDEDEAEDDLRGNGMTSRSREQHEILAEAARQGLEQLWQGTSPVVGFITGRAPLTAREKLRLKLLTKRSDAYANAVEKRRRLLQSMQGKKTRH